MTREGLDVFRGCGNHVYQNADCPHCTNNSALVDKILAYLGERREQPPAEGGTWTPRGFVAALTRERDSLKAENEILAAQAAAHSASVLEIEVRMLAKDALVARLVAELKRYRAHADNGVVDHRLDGVDEDTDALLAEIASPPSAQGDQA